MLDRYLRIPTIDQSPRRSRNPYGEMTEILMLLAEYPIRPHSESLKSSLSVDRSKPDTERPRGTYVYGLILEHPEGQEQGVISLVTRATLGRSSQPWDVYEDVVANLADQNAVLRTGYLLVEDDAVGDVESAGQVPDTGLALSEVLKTYFPGYKVRIEDVR